MSFAPAITRRLCASVAVGVSALVLPALVCTGASAQQDPQATAEEAQPLPQERVKKVERAHLKVAQAAAEQPAGAEAASPPKRSASQDSAGNKKCPTTHARLAEALKQSVKSGDGQNNGGMPFDEWAAVVDRTGKVCAVAFSGKRPTDQWLGSRAIALQKAHTVISFSLDQFAISTANLWAQSQPGGYLYGANLATPPLEKAIYAGKLADYGTKSDPMLGKAPGGMIVFGGGLALYDDEGLAGGLGASGNTSCADHNIAWRVRQKLGLDKVPAGPSPNSKDEIIYDVGKDGKSESGWGHPTCGRTAPQIAQKLGSGVVQLQTEEAARPTPGAVPESTPKTKP